MQLADIVRLIVIECIGLIGLIAYVIVNFDDSLHEYADRYRANIDQYIARAPVPGLEVVLDIKPPFYTAMS